MSDVLAHGDRRPPDVSPVVRLFEALTLLTFVTGLIVVTTYDERPGLAPRTTASPTVSASPSVTPSVHPQVYARRVAAAQRTARFVASQICAHRDPVELLHTRVLERDATKILIGARVGAGTAREGGFELLVGDLPGAVSYLVQSTYGTCEE